MPSLRVVVASSDQLLLRIFDEISNHRDHELILVADEEQLLNAQESERPDLIVIDLDGRNRQGLRLLETMAERSCAATVMLTGSCHARTLGAAGRVGKQRGLSMATPLTKPLDGALVVSTVLDLLPEDQLRLRPRDIEAALDEDQLRLHYQPLVELVTGRVWGAEALLRWSHPEYGQLQPHHIIPLAEKHGLIGPVTRWVAKTAMAQQALWSKGEQPFRMSINVSAQVLRNPDFADEIAAMAAEADIDPSSIVLEVTESQSITEEIDVLDTLTRLRLEDIDLAVDDFGTGYSSLGRLYRLPFSELKIDKSFVMDAHNDPEAEVFVRAITELGRNLNMTVIAEGVASREAWDLVESLGCDVAQGFFIARPLTAEAFGQWLGRWGANGSKPTAIENGNGHANGDGSLSAPGVGAPPANGNGNGISNGSTPQGNGNAATLDAEDLQADVDDGAPADDDEPSES
jgi:EAL domain-containing protein (putative c-di-GMP-specific phosphodiesterase class I)